MTAKSFTAHTSKTTGLIEARSEPRPYDLPDLLVKYGFSWRFDDHTIELRHEDERTETVFTWCWLPNKAEIKQEAINHLKKYHPDEYLPNAGELEAL